MAPKTTFSGPRNLFAVFCLLFLSISIPAVHCSGGVFRVQRKLVGNIEDLAKHDQHRHARLLSGISPVDIPIGGGGGFYYTDIKIGTPPKNYTVMIDTGSDVLWMNCQGCIGCYTNDTSRRSNLALYDYKTSETAEVVRMGDDERCKDKPPECKNQPRPFYVEYFDKSSVRGFVVKDLISYDEVAGDHARRTVRANVKFGCVTERTQNPHTIQAYQEYGIDGIIGFLYEESSMLGQLVSTGKVRKEFAHCFSGDGGGIFAIGHIIKPKVKMTPMSHSVTTHYITTMTSFEVGDKFFCLKDMGVPSDAVIDSGAVTGVLPATVHDYLVKDILSNFSLKDVGGFKCFDFSGNVDEEFPAITFHFLRSVTLKAHPHDYLRNINLKKKHSRCFAWLRDPEDRNLIMGNVVLTNKLVVYDLENKEVGFKEYDCNSSIEVEDDDKDGVCTINAHNESISNPPFAN